MIKFLVKKDPKLLVQEAEDAVFRYLYEIMSFTRDELKDSDYFWFARPKAERLPEDCIFAFTTTVPRQVLWHRIDVVNK